MLYHLQLTFQTCVCVSFSQFFLMCNSSLIMLFYVVSSCPTVEFGLLKTLNRLRTFLSLLLVSYMKPNQYSTMLDWKLEALSTRIYWFLPFPSLPSILTAQTLQLRLGFIHHRGCSCTRPHWAPLWEEDKATDLISFVITFSIFLLQRWMSGFGSRWFSKEWCCSRKIPIQWSKKRANKKTHIY